MEMQSCFREDRLGGDGTTQPRMRTRNDQSTISVFSTTLITNPLPMTDDREVNGNPSNLNPIQIKRTVETIRQSSCDNCLGVGPNHEHTAGQPLDHAHCPESPQAQLGVALEDTPRNSFEGGAQCLSSSPTGVEPLTGYTSTYTHTPVPSFSPTDMFTEGKRPPESESQAFSFPTATNSQQRPLDVHLQISVHHLDGRGDRWRE
ncbi:hypothetical protein DL93DRAFT_2079776 [Clavulina sp. PMI_390]|nr:hypothetical protein DL93DRAFT_2079776 [Clavulina sp. PMI_390]